MNKTSNSTDSGVEKGYCNTGDLPLVALLVGAGIICVALLLIGFFNVIRYSSLAMP